MSGPHDLMRHHPLVIAQMAGQASLRPRDRFVGRIKASGEICLVSRADQVRAKPTHRAAVTCFAPDAIYDLELRTASRLRHIVRMAIKAGVRCHRIRKTEVVRDSDTLIAEQ